MGKSVTKSQTNAGTSNATDNDSGQKEKAPRKSYADWNSADLALACKLATLATAKRDIPTEPIALATDVARVVVTGTKSGAMKGFRMKGTHNTAEVGKDAVGPEVFAMRANLPENWRQVAGDFKRDQAAGLVF